MIRRIGFAVVLVGMLLVSQAPASVTSTFDVDADGWNVISLFGGLAISNETWTFGHNPAAPKSVDFGEPDLGVNGNWQWFVAPSKFTGNMSAYYQDVLCFDLSTSGTDPQPSFYVILQDSLGGDYLYYTSTTVPSPGFATYTVPLDATTAGFGTWYKATGTSLIVDFNYLNPTPDQPGQGYGSSPGTVPATLATDADVLAALTNLSYLMINADYLSGGETTRLDFVGLGECNSPPPPPPSQIPEPGSVILFGLCSLGLVGGCYRRRIKGAAVV